MASDPFYRYKLPSFVLKYEKNKTVVENLADISKKVGRPILWIQKFISYELGAGFITKNDRHIINGTYSVAQLDQILDKFMKSYVSCGTCANPETEIHKMKLVCKACGDTTILNPTHKLSKFLSKNK